MWAAKLLLIVLTCWVLSSDEPLCIALPIAGFLIALIFIV